MSIGNRMAENGTFPGGPNRRARRSFTQIAADYGDRMVADFATLKTLVDGCGTPDFVLDGIESRIIWHARAATRAYLRSGRQLGL